MTTTIKLRRGTAAQWSSSSVILAPGEAGVELDTGKMKVGDGVKLWSLLSYVGAGGYLDSINQNLGTTSAPTFDGINITGQVTEYTYTLTGWAPNINPVNGTIQKWTLTSPSTPSFTMNNGESVTLYIDDGSSYTINWGSVVWKTNSGAAPTLNTTDYTIICIMKAVDTLYGVRVGDA